MKRSGFTFIELLVTLSIASIGFMFAAPSFENIMEDVQLRNAVSQFTSTFSYARAEALRKGKAITICQSSTGLDCDGTNWEDGWLVFTDHDYDENYEPSDGDEILRIWETLPASFTMNSDNIQTTIVFSPSGTLYEPKNSKSIISICSENNLVGSKGIILTRIMAYPARDTNDNDIPESETATTYTDLTSCDP